MRTVLVVTALGGLLGGIVGLILAMPATAIAGKTCVNLNFTAGRESMTAAIERCGITTILTSRKFVAKAEIEPLPGMVFLEDVLPAFSPMAKAAMLTTAFTSSGASDLRRVSYSAKAFEKLADLLLFAYEGKKNLLAPLK